MAKGAIPNNIKIVSNGFDTIYTDQFDHSYSASDYHWRANHSNQWYSHLRYKPLNVIPCTVLDDKNRSSLKTAISRWSNKRIFDMSTGTFSTSTVLPPQIDDRQNIPISGLQLITCEYRTTAAKIIYQLLSKEKYVFDLSPESLMDIVMHAGVDQGFLKCDMIWVKAHRKLQLVRVNSEVHNSILAGKDI